MRRGIVEFLEKIKRGHKYNILIDITSVCNLNCYGCCVGCHENGPKYFIDPEQLKETLPHLKSICNHLDYLVLSGGEPTLHPKFLEICKIVRDIFPNNGILVFSNGILLNKFSQEELNLLKELDITFSISLYPEKKLLNHIYKNIELLEKNNIATAGIFDKSRPVFFKNSINASDIDRSNDNFNSCDKKNEKFFVLIDNKIFGCDIGMLFTNANIPIQPDSYALVHELKNEEQLFGLKTKICSMCNKCIGDKDFAGAQYLIWHTAKEIGKIENLEQTAFDLFINDYDIYQKLQDDNERLIEALKDIRFDYGIMKRNYFDGYPRLMNRYFNGIVDVCIIIKNDYQITDQEIHSLKCFLEKQTVLNKANFYFCCLNLDLSVQKEIFHYFAPSREILNSYIFKANNEQDAMKYFFDNSYCQKYVVLDFNESLDKLQNNQYLEMNAKEKGLIENAGK